MPSRMDLTIQAGNDETIHLTVTTEDGSAVSLVGRQLFFFVKDYASDDDLLARVAVNDNDSAMTLVNADGGVLKVNLRINRHGIYWWRLDVVTQSDDATALYGTLEVEPV